MNDNLTERQKAGRRTFLLINFMFFAPLAVAIFLYFSGMNWKPEGSTEHGKLLLPPATVPDITLAETPEGRKHLRGIWTLLYVGPGECDAVCKERLVELRQMRLTYGPDIKRIQNVFFVTGGSIDKSYFTVEHPKLYVVEADEAAEAVAVVTDIEPGAVFVIDPQGNLMMRFEADEDIANIRKDLKKLLKLSRIG